MMDVVVIVAMVYLGFLAIVVGLAVGVFLLNGALDLWDRRHLL